MAAPGKRRWRGKHRGQVDWGRCRSCGALTPAILTAMASRAKSPGIRASTGHNCAAISCCPGCNCSIANLCVGIC